MQQKEWAMCRYKRKMSVICLAASFLKESDISDLWRFSKFEDIKSLVLEVSLNWQLLNL
jgi:hypothetical protein